MRKILYAVVIIAGISEISCGMQKGVTSSRLFYGSEGRSPFAFIEQSLTLDDSDSEVSSTMDSEWKSIARMNEEELDDRLVSTDLDDSTIKSLELVNAEVPMTEGLEQAFFGNKTLYNWFLAIKEKIIQGEKLSSSQKNCLSWLIQNRRGDYECAKMLVTSYGLISKGKLLYLRFGSMFLCF